MKNKSLKIKTKKLIKKATGFAVCLAVMFSVFGGITASAASRFPEPNGGTSNGLGTFYWTLTPGNNGQHMYDKIESDIHGPKGVKSSLKQYTFISKENAATTLFDENKAYSWQDDCKGTSFAEGNYYVYIYHYGLNVNYYIRHEYIVNISHGYEVGISVSGAGGKVTIGGSEYSGGTYKAGTGDSIAFTVSSIADYTPVVTFNGQTLTANNGTYTISNSMLAAASDRTIKVNYTMTNGSVVTLVQSSTATITINGNSASTQTLGKSGTYTLKAEAKGKNIVTKLMVDGETFFLPEGASIVVEGWKPTKSTHTVTATTEPLSIKVFNGKTVSIRDEMDAKARAEAVFNAIYDTSSRVKLNADDIVINHGSSFATPGVYMNVDLYGNFMPYGTYNILNTPMDYTALLGDDDQETVYLEWRYNNISEYESDKVTVNIDKISISAKTALEKVYDGSPFEISTALENNSQLQWQNNVGDVVKIEAAYHYDSSKNLLADAPTAAGDYFIRVKATDSLGSNTSDFIPYSIKPRDITNVDVHQTGTLVYNNNQLLTAQVSASADIYGVAVPQFSYSMTENGTYGDMPGLISAGQHTVYYKVTAENHNDYYGSFTVTIEQATPATENVQAVIEADKALAGDAAITGTAAFNDELVNGQFAAENPAEALIYGENTIGYIFTPYDAINFKTVKGTVTVNVTDTVAPTGEVKIEDSSWTELLNSITFDRFFKETVDVTVTAADTLSGIKSVEYIESGTALTQTELESADNWTSMDADRKVSVTAEDAKQFVYYIRITDNAGNVTYLSTDGATFDTKPPVIHGITEGATYYTTQKFSVQDDNFENVTVNGSQSMTFALGGNADSEYVVIATDKAGNSTTVTVQMKPIASISETIKDLTENNVTGDNADTIKAVEEALAAVDKTNASPAEKDALAAAQANVDALQKVIEDTAAEVKVLQDTLAGYDKDTVKSTDETAVDQLIDDLTEKLKDENLSAGQKFALGEAVADAQKLADKIDDDKAALEEANNSVPAVDTDKVTADNAEDLAAAKDKLEDIVNDDNYTAEEKQSAQEQIDKIEGLEEIIKETKDAVDDAVAEEGYADKTADDVTSADKTAIDENLTAIKDILEDKADNLTAEQKTALETAKTDAEKLLKEIADNAQALEDALEAEKGTTENNYQLSDKENLQDAVEDLEAITDENNKNYTSEEKQKAQTELDRINSIIDDIEEIEDTSEKADNAADKQNNVEVVTDNKEAVEAAVKAKQAYDQLNEKQKEVLGQEKAEQIEAMYNKAVAFEIINGADGEWTDGSSRTLGFTANGSFKLFKEVRVVNAKGNSTTLVRDVDYTAQQGSTIVTLRKAYLDTLSVGEYKLEVVYDVLGTEHIADCSFTVKAKAENTVKSVDGGMDMITVDGKNLAGFDRLVFEYTINVPYEKTSVTLGGKTSHPAAKADNLWEIPLDVGENVIVIKTTAENEAYNWFYTITVNRAAKAGAPQTAEKPAETPQPSETPAPTAEPQPTTTPDVPADDTSAPQQAERTLPIIPVIVAVFAAMIILIIVKKKRNDEE